MGAESLKGSPCRNPGQGLWPRSWRTSGDGPASEARRYGRGGGVTTRAVPKLTVNWTDKEHRSVGIW